MTGDGLNKRWRPVRRYNTVSNRRKTTWQWEDPVREGWLYPQAPWTLWMLLMWMLGLRTNLWPRRHVDPRKVRRGVALYPLQAGPVSNVTCSEGQPRSPDVPVGGFQMWEATEGVQTTLVRRRVA